MYPYACLIVLEVIIVTSLANVLEHCEVTQVPIHVSYNEVCRCSLGAKVSRAA